MDFYLFLFLIFVTVMCGTTIFVSGMMYESSDILYKDNCLSDRDMTIAKVEFVVCAAICMFITLLCFWMVL